MIKQMDKTKFWFVIVLITHPNKQRKNDQAKAKVYFFNIDEIETFLI